MLISTEILIPIFRGLLLVSYSIIGSSSSVICIEPGMSVKRAYGKTFSFALRGRITLVLALVPDTGEHKVGWGCWPLGTVGVPFEPPSPPLGCTSCLETVSEYSSMQLSKLCPSFRNLLLHNVLSQRLYRYTTSFQHSESLRVVIEYGCWTLSRSTWLRRSGHSV